MIHEIWFKYLEYQTKLYNLSLPKGWFQLKVTVNMIRSYVFSTSKDV